MEKKISKKIMTHEQKIQYMCISAGICNYGIHEADLDLLISLYELVLKKKGKTDCNSILETKAQVEKREYLRNLKERCRKANYSPYQKPTSEHYLLSFDLDWDQEGINRAEAYLKEYYLNHPNKKE